MSDAIKILTLLIGQSELVTLEYWSEFILGFQRDNAVPNPTLQERFGSIRIPPFFRIRLRGKWWIGNRQKWEAAIRDFAYKGVAPVTLEGPLQASLMMTKLGSSVLAVNVNMQGDLTLDLSDGDTITVQGVGGGWDESWFLELPLDDPDHDLWSIVCDSDASISAKFPDSVRTG
jgi:hypothetical protein